MARVRIEVDSVRGTFRVEVPVDDLVGGDALRAALDRAIDIAADEVKRAYDRGQSDQADRRRFHPALGSSI